MLTFLKMVAAIAALALAVGTGHGRQCTPHWTGEFAAAVHGTATVTATYDDGSGAGPALFIAGDFTHVMGVPASNIARFDGKSWTSVGQGVDGKVAAMAVFDDGSGAALCVAEYFETSSEITASQILKWDGNDWTEVGPALDGSLEALVVFDDHSGPRPALFAAGGISFGGTPSQQTWLLKWTGDAWLPASNSSVASGAVMITSATVFDDGAGDGPALYAVGYFPIGGIYATRVAKWNGQQWSAITSALPHEAESLMVLGASEGPDGPHLYVGGPFFSFQGIQAHRIVKWNGQSWSAVGAGLPGAIVTALAIHHDSAGPALYVGGLHSISNPSYSAGVVRWNGSTWTMLGPGPGQVDAMAWVEAEPADDLLIMGPYVPSGMARRENNDWQPLNRGITGGIVFDLATSPVDQSTLYAGGAFTHAGQVRADSIAKWDGRSWSALGEGLTSTGPNDHAFVNAIAFFEDKVASEPALYAGGRFNRAGTKSASNLARWDGANWIGLDVAGSGVYALAVFDDGSGPALYAGGLFSSAGGVPATNIARFDGTTWTSIGPVAGPVFALQAFDDGTGPALYVGGDFSTAGGVSAQNIAKWDGKVWSKLDEGLYGGLYDRVAKLALHDDGSGPTLVAGGRFNTAGAQAANNIARWRGGQWSNLGAGVDGFVYDLAAFDDGFDQRPALYVAGNFEQAGPLDVASIARWNGVMWTPVSASLPGEDVGSSGYVSGLEVFAPVASAPSLIAGGEFIEVDGAPSSNIARWFGCPIEAPPATPPCHYEVQFIELPPSAGVSDRNNSGQIVGRLSANMLYVRHDAKLTTIPFPDGALNADSVQIGESSAIVATFSFPGTSYRGYRYAAGQWTQLEPLAGDVNTSAADINTAEEVAATRRNATASIACEWDDGVYQDIAGAGIASSSARGLNDDGLLVGQFYPEGQTSNPRAFAYQNGSFTDLGLLPRAVNSIAHAANNKGTIVGSSRVNEGSDAEVHVWVYSGGSLTDLGTLAGLNSRPVDINERGQIVGNAEDAQNVRRAFVIENGIMTALEDLIPADEYIEITQGLAIDDAGVILAYSSAGAVLLTPVPPSPADLNGDCHTNVEDLLILLYEWGRTDSPADFNGDGIVDLEDLLIMIGNWR